MIVARENVVINPVESHRQNSNGAIRLNDDEEDADVIQSAFVEHEQLQRLQAQTMCRQKTLLLSFVQGIWLSLHGWFNN